MSSDVYTEGKGDCPVRVLCPDGTWIEWTTTFWVDAQPKAEVA